MCLLKRYEKKNIKRKINNTILPILLSTWIEAIIEFYVLDKKIFNKVKSCIIFGVLIN